MNTLILIGSLRAESFSRKLAHAAQDLAPEGMTFTIQDCADVPLYNQDHDGETKPPGAQALLDAVNAAEALIVITPEYNYGIPGTLKNAIDWASRPAFQSPLKDKPTLTIGVSMAPTGGARAYQSLGVVLGGTLTPVYLAPAFLVPTVHEKFDESGALTDDVTARRLGKTLTRFKEWVESRQA